MQERELTISNKAGIHTRAASLFVQAASKFVSTVRLENLQTGCSCDAKSIALVLSLDLKYETPIRIYAEGPDETPAVNVLMALL